MPTDDIPPTERVPTPPAGIDKTKREQRAELPEVLRRVRDEMIRDGVAISPDERIEEIEDLVEKDGRP